MRYADDFIIGVRGPKETVIKIQKEVKDFLKSTLHLSVNEDKTRITHVFSDKANFLGMQIHMIPTNFLFPFLNPLSPHYLRLPLEDFKTYQQLCW